MRVGIGYSQHRNIEQVYLKKRKRGKKSPQNKYVKTSEKISRVAGNKTTENKSLKQNNIS